MDMYTLIAPLIGTWESQQETLSCVKYTVSYEDGQPVVTAIDSYDNETPEIYDVRWLDSEHCLYFCCYWECSGRFLKCKMSAMPSGARVNFVYQYTGDEILVKSSG